MIKSVLSIFFSSALFLATLIGFEVSAADLTVNVKGIKKVEGQLHYQLFQCPLNEDAAWTELTPLISQQVAVSSKELTFSLPNLYSGKYVARIFQDLNNNQELDFTSGLPLEPAGFSTNPTLMLGYPQPLDNCFSFDEKIVSTHTIVISVKNKRQRKRKKI